MLDFRLQVFYTVARRLSFTKAAAELFITQPAVTKHIHELENQFGTALFERKGNQILLTAAGQIMQQHAETIAATYRQMEFDLNTLKQKVGGTLRLGGSSTVAQYLLPPILARFHAQYADVAVSLLSGNTQQIEQALLKKDYWISPCWRPNPPQLISGTHLLCRTKIVLVMRADHPLSGRDELSLDELKTTPMLLRERGSGTLEVIDYALRSVNVKMTDLNVEMYLGKLWKYKIVLIAFALYCFLVDSCLERWIKKPGHYR